MTVHMGFWRVAARSRLTPPDAQFRSVEPTVPASPGIGVGLRSMDNPGIPAVTRVETKSLMRSQRKFRKC
jgi:hypothetical protein